MLAFALERRSTLRSLMMGCRPAEELAEDTGFPTIPGYLVY